MTTLNMALGGTATEGWGGTTPVACTEFEIQVQVSDFLEYISVLLFNKLSLCPYMVRKPSISVIRT